MAAIASSSGSISAAPGDDPSGQPPLSVLDSLPPLDADWACRQPEHRDGHHMFLSYRVSADHAMVETLALAAANGSEGHASVFLDRYCLNQGEDWEAGFLNGLRSARLIVLLISEGTLEGIKRAHEQADNVLLEYEVALERAHRKEAMILPIFVGRYADVEVDGTRTSAFIPFNAYNLGVYSENKPAHPRSRAESVRGIMKKIFKLQGETCDPRRIRDAAAAIRRFYVEKCRPRREEGDEEVEYEEGGAMGRGGGGGPYMYGDDGEDEAEDEGEEIEGQTFGHSMHRHLLMGSELKDGEQWRGRWICDVCGQAGTRNRMRFRCARGCDFDVCEGCMRDDARREGGDEGEDDDGGQMAGGPRDLQGGSGGGQGPVVLPGAWFEKMGQGLGLLTGRKRRFFVLAGARMHYFVGFIGGQPYDEKGYIQLCDRTTVYSRDNNLFIHTPAGMFKEPRLWDLLAESRSVAADWEHTLRMVVNSLQ